jgi:hypothetical protein
MCTSGYLQGERCTLWASLTSIPGRYCRGSCRIRWILIFVSQPLNKRFWSMQYRVFSMWVRQSIYFRDISLRAARLWYPDQYGWKRSIAR